MTQSEWFVIEYKDWSGWYFASIHQTLESARQGLALDLRVMREKERRIIKCQVIEEI